MTPVAQVNDYQQWAQSADRGQTVHLAAAAVTTAPSQAAPKAAPYAPYAPYAFHDVPAAHAAHDAHDAHAAQAPQLSGAQDDDQRYHTYYYVPRSDAVNSSYYYAWPRGAGQYSGTQYSGQYYGPGYNNPYSYHHNWFGRTSNEVYRDNMVYSTRRHGSDSRRGDQEMVPRDPADDQMFYVKELDGHWTLRSYNTIENDLRPGYWDKYHGRAHFVRTRD
ncbi:uncharacterized protein BKCO1_34000108 [Diplodia corticola]|uniref:Uncharacterized protein n=1 Tax=Diplodia corticola TaxID=236234 RepID=A0A1J9QY71_9PEZI|nr:uncharacterized protein BKCO1_34000108 [Diplodia corticola]OJD32946.1 hypothetical protein BKCO1_34000108 [Diplodia corticola]